jgi:hypothetical protein
VSTIDDREPEFRLVDDTERQALGMTDDQIRAFLDQPVRPYPEPGNSEKGRARD